MCNINDLWRANHSISLESAIEICFSNGSEIVKSPDETTLPESIGYTEQSGQPIPKPE